MGNGDIIREGLLKLAAGCSTTKFGEVSGLDARLRATILVWNLNVCIHIVISGVHFFVRYPFVSNSK